MKIFPAIVFASIQDALLWQVNPDSKSEAPQPPFVSQSMVADGRKIINNENTALIMITICVLHQNYSEYRKPHVSKTELNHSAKY
jgi:hypothetical protein